MIHIIAGTYRGRRLLPPPADAQARPITGLAKKSLFGILARLLPGAAVMDLYCGTGTIGLEALSRGADRCFFADKDQGVISRLRRNIEALGAAGKCTIWTGDVMSRLAGWLAGGPDSIDIAFVDPPYSHARTWDWPDAQLRIFAPLAARLAPNGVVVLRHPAGLKPPESLGDIEIVRAKTYGGMAVTIYGLRKPAGPDKPHDCART